MKIAICGSSPLGIELAVQLHQMGAHVTVFAKENLPFGLGGTIRKLSFLSSEIKDYIEGQLEPKIKYCYENGLVKFGEVDRVQKRFLSTKETPQHHTRMIDLFRVVYKVTPGEEVAIPDELKKEFDQDVLESLSKGFERFEDFDFVVDASGRKTLPMGPGENYALNEKQVKDQASIFYGYNGLVDREKWNHSSKNIIIVGSGKVAALTLLKSEINFANPEVKVTLITDEERPFEKLFREAKDEALLKELGQFFDVQENAFNEKIETFESEMRKWKDLDKNERMKTPPPVEPSPQFDIIPGANITSLDKLIDREGLFVTVESPGFRESRPEYHLKTLPADTVLVCTGHQKNSQLNLNNFTEAEPGLYSLLKGKDGEPILIHQAEKHFQVIIKDMLSYFAKNEEQPEHV